MLHPNMFASPEKNTKREQYINELKRCMDQAGKMAPEERLFQYQGIPYPAVLCSLETFQAMKTIEAREDDVLLATYPKCGTNWASRILHEMFFTLQNKELTPGPIILEYGKYKDLDQLPSPRFLLTHLACDNIPKVFFEKKAKPMRFTSFLRIIDHNYSNGFGHFILVVLRNPKDNAVSRYHVEKDTQFSPNHESWNRYFEDYTTGNVMYGSYFEYILGWERHVDDKNILVLTFEDLKMDFPEQLRKMCEFCGLSLTNEQIEQVQEKTTFAYMKENSANTHGDLGKFVFRKGEIGDWRSLFTEKQSKVVDALFEKHLAGTKLGGMLNYAKYCTY